MESQKFSFISRRIDLLVGPVFFGHALEWRVLLGARQTLPVAENMPQMVWSSRRRRRRQVTLVSQ